MLFDIFIIIIVLFLLLVTAIFAVKYNKTGRTFQESTKICVDFVKNIFREFWGVSEPAKPNYPVFIGSNGYVIIPENVESSFEELSKHFEVFYFDRYDNTLANRIIYRFKISNSKIDMDYLKFIELLQKISEKVLFQHLRNQDVYIPCDNFIAVKIAGDILYISIAKNDIGIAETMNIRRKIRNNYYATKRKQEQEEIQTDWDESNR